MVQIDGIRNISVCIIRFSIRSILQSFPHMPFPDRIGEGEDIHEHTDLPAIPGGTGVQI